MQILIRTFDVPCAMAFPRGAAAEFQQGSGPGGRISWSLAQCRQGSKLGADRRKSSNFTKFSAEWSSSTLYSKAHVSVCTFLVAFFQLLFPLRRPIDLNNKSPTPPNSLQNESILSTDSE